jgi:hypothetical protein
MGLDSRSAAPVSDLPDICFCKTRYWRIPNCKKEEKLVLMAKNVVF